MRQKNQAVAVLTHTKVRTEGWRRFGFLSLQLCLFCAATATVSRAQTAESLPSYTVLYNFTGGADGATPLSGLIADEAGNLYGTTSAGGNTTSSCPFGSSGCGVVFKLDPSGKETVLHTFNGPDGQGPLGGLIRDAAGNLYGATNDGGNTSSSCPFGSLGCGLVFKLDPSGRETVLYTFSGEADGSSISFH